jgi:DNA-binding NtrC family response regulator
MTQPAALAKILITDDDPVFQLAVKHALKGKYEFFTAMNGEEALIQLKKNSFAAVLLDIQMRSDDEGLKMIPRIREADPEISIIMSTSIKDFGTVRQAMTLGANDYVPKDFDPEELAHALARALDRRSLVKSRSQQNFEAAQKQKRTVMIGKSRAIESLRSSIEKIRGSWANVVITGDTGTGKEVVARQLRRTLADGNLEPFVSVDSSTIQSTMAESLLFGHEKGAFTGADKAVRGIFEEANGGTVYFDEIANMPLDIQAKLLRVLQEKEVLRLGSGKVIELQFRVICATNRDLDEMAAQGQFKPDLLQRLNVIPLALPPLKDRKEDIPLLVEHFCRAETKREGFRFTAEALEALNRHDWPGNIRELHNLVSYLAVMTDSEEVDLADLPPKIRDSDRARGTAPSSGGSFYDQVAGFERKILEDALASSGGNVSKLALSLGMDRSHLHSKLKQFGIQRPKG